MIYVLLLKKTVIVLLQIFSALLNDNFLGNCLLVLWLILLFLSRKGLLILSEKLVNSNLVKHKENKVIKFLFFWCCFYIILGGGILIEITLSYLSIDKIVILMMQLFWVVFSINLVVFFENVVVFFKKLMLIRQSYFFFTFVLACILLVSDFTPNIENLISILEQLIQHKNGMVFLETEIDDVTFLENRYMLAGQVFWLYLFIKLLGVFLDPNLDLMFKLGFALLGPLLPGIGFFKNYSLESNVVSKETKLLFQKPKGENKPSKAKVFPKIKPIPTDDLLSNEHTKKILELAKKNDITPIKTHTELSITYCTQVTRCVTKIKEEYKLNLQKVTNLFLKSNEIIKNEKIHKDYPELTNIINVKEGIASYNPDTTNFSYENSVEKFNACLGFKNDFENTFNIRFDNALSAVSVRNNNLIFFNSNLNGMTYDTRTTLLHVGTVFHINNVLVAKNFSLEKLLLLNHDIDNLPTLRIQLFSKLLPQYISLAEIEQEGEYLIVDKNYKKGYGEVIMQHKMTKQHFLLEMKVITSENYDLTFTYYSNKLVDQVLKTYKDSKETVKLPVLLCICILPGKGHEALDLNAKTKELQTKIDEKIKSLGEEAIPLNLTDKIKGKVILIKGANE